MRVFHTQIQYCRGVEVTKFTVQTVTRQIFNGSRLISVVPMDCFETRNRGLVERTSFVVNMATSHGTAKTDTPLKIITENIYIVPVVSQEGRTRVYFYTQKQSLHLSIN
jgi:hypothetical protein